MDQWSLDEWTNRVDLPPVHGKAGQSVLPMVAGAKGHGAELRGQGLALHIENLQHLALVSKVCKELEIHVGVGDKTLAEFIINLAEENEGLPAFQRALESNGAEFPDSFVITLHAMIVRMRPKKKPKTEVPVPPMVAGMAGAQGHGAAEGGGAEGGGEQRGECDAGGWSWCSTWWRYIHCETKTMWDPARAVYSKWDDAGNVVDYPGEQRAGAGSDRSATTPQYRTDGDATKERGAKEDASSGFGICEESEEEGEYVDTIDCRSTDGSSEGTQEDGELEARFVEYYKREQGGDHDLASDYRARRKSADEAGQDDDTAHADAIVSGDWVWDGEFWNNADGVSYHPSLKQYFSHGKRIFPSDEDKPKLCDEKLMDDFLLKKYQDQYGTWASNRSGEGAHVTGTVTRGGGEEEESQGMEAEHQRSHGANVHGEGSTSQAKRGRTHVLGHNSSIGRSKSCALFIPRSALSRQHAKLAWEHKKQGFVLRNCSRRKQTFHNGKTVAETGVLLAQGDVIFLGSSSTLFVVAVHVGGADSDPHITLRHSERGAVCVGEKGTASNLRHVRAAREQRGAVQVHLDGEPLEGEGAGESSEAGGTYTYKDRAAERRSLHADAEAMRRCEDYRSRQQLLQHRQAAREEKARRVQELEATLAAIDAGCFRMPVPSQDQGQALAAAYPAGKHPAPDPEWKERGAKMLKMMGWTEGQGLGRQEHGITVPIDTCMQTGKSGLGLAAELSHKAAERLVVKLGLAERVDSERA